MRGANEARSRFDFSLDNRQVVLIISGVIVVLMLAFLMGTLFGRNLTRMSGEDLYASAGDQQMAETGDLGDAPAGAEIEEPAADDPALDGWMISADDSEDLGASPGAADDSVSRADYIKELESMKIPTTVIRPEEGNLDSGSDAPAMASMDDAKAPADLLAPPAAKPQPEPNPKPKPEPARQAPKKTFTPRGNYTIQLASLPDRGEADRVVGDLQGKRFDAYMLQVSIPGKGTFYRVRVGHYETLEQAKKALAIIQARESNYYDAWITQ